MWQSRATAKSSGQWHCRAHEAEYRGATIATCEVIWLKRLLRDLQVEVSDPTTIFCDNLSSIHLAKNPVFHTRTNHIEVHYHFVCEHVLSGCYRLGRLVYTQSFKVDTKVIALRGVVIVSCESISQCILQRNGRRWLQPIPKCVTSSVILAVVACFGEWGYGSCWSGTFSARSAIHICSRGWGSSWAVVSPSGIARDSAHHSVLFTVVVILGDMVGGSSCSTISGIGVTMDSSFICVLSACVIW